MSDRETIKLQEKIARLRSSVTSIDSKSVPLNRITVVTNAVHEISGDNPKSISCSFCEVLDSDEEPYERRLKAREAWTKLDTGHIDDSALNRVFINNLEGINLAVQPTDEELTDIRKRSLQICLAQRCWKLDDLFSMIEVPPGHLQPLKISSDIRIYVRSTYDRTMFRVTAIPM